MKESIKLKIITMVGIFLSEEVSEIILPTDTGQITILPGHIPLISKIKSGVLVTKTGSDQKTYNVTDGVVEVRPGSEVYILVDKAFNI